MLNCASEDQNPICVEPLRRLISESGRFLFWGPGRQPGQGNQTSPPWGKLESLDDVSQGGTFQIPFLWTWKFEVPNSGQNPGKNQQDVGEFCWSFYWVLNGGHGSIVWRTAVAPKTTSCHMGWPLSLRSSLNLVMDMGVSWFRKGLPILFVLQFPDQ